MKSRPHNIHNQIFIDKSVQNLFNRKIENKHGQYSKYAIDEIFLSIQVNGTHEMQKKVLKEEFKATFSSCKNRR